MIPLSAGGTEDDENLQGLCKPCHDEKSARERGRPLRMAVGLDGWPTDPEHHWNKAGGGRR